MEADLLLHVVDLSHPHCDLQMETVQGVLAELGIGDRSTLVVYNKVDRVARCNTVEAREKPAPARGAGVDVSAISGTGLDVLRERIRARCRQRTVTLDLRIPYAEGRLLSQVHGHGEVLGRTCGPNDVRLRVRLDPQWVGRFRLERFRDA